MQVDSGTPEPSLAGLVRIGGRRWGGYSIFVYGVAGGVRLVRRGRYRRLTVGPLSVEWYPS